MYIIVSSRSDYRNFEMLSLFNLDFTFNQCILSDLQALPRLLLQYVTPIYILLLLVIVLFLTKIKGFSKLLGEHSFLKALWLIVLMSYLNIANSTFEILNCQKIGPRNAGFSENVLEYDAAVLCWTGLHLPFAIIAVLLATFLVVPFPFYAGFAIKVPKWKPITDVYCSLYRDEQRYWIIWNLLRRVLMVMISVFISDFIKRHFFLLLTSVGILAVSVSTWPYKYWLDNAFSVFVLTALLVFCVVTQPEIYILVDPDRIVSWSIVAFVCLMTLCLVSVEIFIWFLSRKGTNYTKDYFTPSKGRAKLSQLFVTAGKRAMKRQRNVLELEESVHSNQYYGHRDTSGYKEFREPLIDSDRFSSVGIMSVNNTGGDTDRALSSKENPRAGINSSFTISKSVVTHSTVSRDE